MFRYAKMSATCSEKVKSLPTTAKYSFLRLDLCVYGRLYCVNSGAILFWFSVICTCNMCVRSHANVNNNFEFVRVAMVLATVGYNYRTA